MKPWTVHPSDDVDLPTVIALARQGMTVAAWREAAHAELPQARASARERVIRRALELLDVAGDVLAPSSFLEVFNAAGVSPRDRTGVLVARRFALHPWVLLAARELLLPILAESERPLAQRSSVVEPAELDAFLGAHLDPCSATARADTRLALLRALRTVGTLVKRRGALHAVRAYPAPIAVAWMLNQQIHASGRIALFNRDARTSSDAATAYALTPDYVDTCIGEGERGRLLVQSYLASTPRIHLPDQAPPA